MDCRKGCLKFVVLGAASLLMPSFAGATQIYDHVNQYYQSQEVESAYNAYRNNNSYQQHKQHKRNAHKSDSIEYKQYAQSSGNSFIFSPRTLQWKAMSNGKVVRTGHGSAGKGYCPDIKRSCRTPTGTFRISRMGGPGCKSSRYPVGQGGAPMPYCMFFSKYYAIHGSPDVPNYNASHGCVRVPTSDARWLSNFLHVGSKVVITSY